LDRLLGKAPVAIDSTVVRADIGAMLSQWSRERRTMRLSEFLRVTATPQARFAAQIGLRQPSVSRLVNGAQNPSATVVLKIRDATQGAVAADDWAPEKKIRRLSGC
jgi:DNA-binding transcriptional regulator YdaS (Cro superfamily)